MTIVLFNTLFALALIAPPLVVVIAALSLWFKASPRSGEAPNPMLTRRVERHP